MNHDLKESIINIINEEKGISEKEVLIKKINEVFSANYNEPIGSVVWIPLDSILPNGYNPNKMAPPEKRTLLRSMLCHGITAPLVVTPKENEIYRLIDGYHRWYLIKTSKELRIRLANKVPVVVLDISDNERIVATIRHNRARGKHQITEISEVVQTLSQNGWPPQKIMTELGMDADEVLRLKQFKGLGDKFKEEDYSTSWK